MNLLPIIREEEIGGKKQKVVSVKELYEKLGLRQDHFKRWCEQNIEFLFENGQEWIFHHDGEKSEKRRGRPTKDYLVTLDVAKELAMLARTEEGKQVRRAFIALEKEYQKIIGGTHLIQAGEETAKFFNNFLDLVAQYSPTAKITVGAQIASKVYGITVPYSYLPQVTVSRWSASEIAKEFGVSAVKVGKIANRLNLKCEPYAERRLSVAKYTNKEVAMWYYNQEAKDLIKALV